MPTIALFVAGVVAVALVTAFGLHSTQLTGLTKQVGSSSSQLLGTAETGKD